MQSFTSLKTLKKSDRVAIISPSDALSEFFPWVYELGIKRIKENFGLEIVEYPTTHKQGSELKDRARDAMNAFADRDVKAIITTIGGNDQIQLLKYLDPEVIKANPKPFFGYSDNTHIVNYLWKLGIPSYYGGCVLTQFAMQGEMDSFTEDYLRWAMFDGGPRELSASTKFNEIGLDWSDKSTLNSRREYMHHDGWQWDGSQDASGVLWGGCVESLIAQVSARVFLPTDEQIEGCVLMIETAEDIPEHWIIEYLLVGLGERGWLSKFNGIFVGRPKAWEFNKQLSTEERDKYREKQRETIISTVRKYNSDIPIVQNMDFGHTDPQIVMPAGRLVTINSSEKKVSIS